MEEGKEEIYYYRYQKYNVGIVSDSPTVVSEIMMILNKAQFGDEDE